MINIRIQTNEQTCWVYNDILQAVMKIKKEELVKFLSEDWKRGRKINYLDVG